MSAESSAAPGPRLRVASVPGDDPYVRAALPPAVAGSLLRGAWLDLGYLTAHAADVDVLHLHLGHDQAGERRLEPWSETVRRLGVPLVVTVHRLPAEESASAEDVGAVLAHAEVVLTLTPAAADEIADRYGRTAIVVAHPSLVRPLPDLGTERGLVGLVLGAGTLGRRELVAAARCGALSGGGRLRLVVDGSLPSAAVAALAGDGVEVGEQSRNGEGWVAQLQQLHVAVLPERCRSHSRDLEVCRDVGTRVVAPACGWLPDQWADVVTYGASGDGRLDGMSVIAAVAAALTRPAPRPAPRQWREEQQAAVQAVHAQVYGKVAADRRR